MDRKDEQFGVLTSTRDLSNNRTWLTSVALPYFRSSGANLDQYTFREKKDPLSSEALFRKGRFLLNFYTQPDMRGKNSMCSKRCAAAPPIGRLSYAL